MTLLILMLERASVAAEPFFVGLHPLCALLLEFHLEEIVQRAVDRSKEAEGDEGDGGVYGEEHEDDDQKNQDVDHCLENGHKEAGGQLVDFRQDVLAEVARVAVQEKGVGPAEVDGQQPVGEGVVPVEDELGFCPHGKGGDPVREYDEYDDGDSQGGHEFPWG